MTSRTPNQGDPANGQDRNMSVKREPSEPEEPAGFFGLP